MLLLAEKATALPPYAETSERFSLAQELIDHRFSRRQAQELTGLDSSTTLSLAPKADKTGGRLAAASIHLLSQAAELPPKQRRPLLAKAYEAGTSVDMIARLLDMSRTTVWHNIKRHEKEALKNA